MGNIGFGCYQSGIDVGNKAEYDAQSKNQIPSPAVCTNPYQKIKANANDSKGTKNPIYAYQFRYDIQFPEGKKVEMSQNYRQMTGLDGTYDGVNMTYTFYTWQENGVWKNWENYGGWLVYGQKNPIQN